MRRLRQHSPQLAAAERAAQAEARHPLPLPTAEQQAIREAAGIRFELIGGGMDARFVDGRFPGQLVSDLVKTVEGRDYLGTLWRTASNDLRIILRTYFSD
jgi:hypothetical protein